QTDPAGIGQLAQQLCPADTGRTIERADAFLAGEFRLLEAKPAARLPDPAHPDWIADPVGDVEWPHSLNRFRKFARCLSRASLYTADRRYANRLLDLMDDWIHANPRGRPIAWSSMEISVRTLEWSGALYALRGSAALDAP